MHAIHSIARAILFATFAIWFGGFLFYTAIVVPIGTDVLSSAFDQGLITRQVTQRLNVACGFAIVAMILERREKTRWHVIPMVVMSIALVVLLLLHPKIDAHIDMTVGEVRDYSDFYALHRTYLWTSTVQWFAGLAWLAAAIPNGKSPGLQ